MAQLQGSMILWGARKVGEVENAVGEGANDVLHETAGGEQAIGDGQAAGGEQAIGGEQAVGGE